MERYQNDPVAKKAFRELERYRDILSKLPSGISEGSVNGMRRSQILACVGELEKTFPNIISLVAHTERLEAYRST